MSLRQIRLVPSGVQTWFRNIIAASDDMLAYASTMALYFFRVKDMSLVKMITAHQRTISSVCWCPTNSMRFASCAQNGEAVIWNLETEKEEKRITFSGDELFSMDWAPTPDAHHLIAVGTDKGEVKLWDLTVNQEKKLFSTKDGLKVLRWHPQVTGLLIVGCAEGSMVMYNHAKQQQTKLDARGVKGSKEPIADLQWDPLSTDYLLAAFADGSLTLYDVARQALVHQFDKQTPGNHVHCISWLRAQPGNFITASDKSGVLKIWNVSQKSPMGQIKVGVAGINSIVAMPSQPDLAVIAFKNGSIGVCDTATKKMQFATAPGHCETVFDVLFHPEDRDLFATASYDGYVKLWRVSTGEICRELYAGNNQYIYGLSFSPVKEQQICAVSSQGFLFIWNTNSGEEIARVQIHKESIFRVEWSPIPGDKRIATGSQDKTACIINSRQSDVSTARKIKHPGQVVGVQWHNQAQTLCTACEDGIIRMFNAGPDVVDDTPHTMCSGHNKRVFNISFHPSLPHILASGSDDRTVRIWDTSPGLAPEVREKRRLEGHKLYVRALLWHAEMPHVLFSGSWDATIRVWDVALGVEIYVATEHHADVYGLTAHPSRPFLLISSSRDTSLRFWACEELAQSHLLRAVMHPEKFEALLGNAQTQFESKLQAAPTARVAGPPPLLCGVGSRALAAELRTLLQGSDGQAGSSSGAQLRAMQKICSFFLYRRGLDDLWRLIANVRNESPDVFMHLRSMSVFHEREIISCQRSRAMELCAQTGTVGIQGKREERLLQAAQILLRIGELRQYCQTMCQIGRWERAICVAPAVSMDFWRQLCAEYAENQRANADLSEAAPFLVASGMAGLLMDAYLERNELHEAFAVAKAQADGRLPAADQAVASALPGAAVVAGLPKGEQQAGDRRRLVQIAAVLAKRYLALGEPVEAAMCFLAVSEIERAVSTLVRAQEVVLAYLVESLTLTYMRNQVGVTLLAKSCERYKLWDVAAEVWQSHPDAMANGGVRLALLAARCTDAEALSQWAPLIAQCRADLGTVLQDEHPLKGHGLVITQGDAEAAVELAVARLHALFASEAGWEIAEARQILEPVESVPLQQLQVKSIANLLACAAYIGFIEAAFLGYHDMIFPLAQTVRNIVTHQNLPFPVSMDEVTLCELAFSQAHTNPVQAVDGLSALSLSPGLPPHLQPVAVEQQRAAQQHTTVDIAVNARNTAAAGGLRDPFMSDLVLSGGNLPAGGKKETSVLTNCAIIGPCFLLEDGKTFISLREALTWARVNAWSPLNTGHKTEPF